MELKWSLEEIYKSFDSDEFKRDLEKVDNLITNFNYWTNETVKK